MSYWQIPEDTLYSILDLNPQGYTDDDMAGDIEDENSKKLVWAPTPKPDPRQQKFEFAASVAAQRQPFGASAKSYCGTRKTTALTPQYSEVTEQTLLDEINEIEIKIEMLEEEGNLPAAREEQRVLDELLDMYGNDEYDWSEADEGAPGVAEWVVDEDEGRWASTKRTAARTQRPQALAKKIKQLLDAAQAEWDEVIGKPDPVYNEVFIRVGPEVARYIESEAPLAITYEGAAYDMLSYSGEMEHMGGSDLRRDIINAAAEMGYLAEDQNSWSMAFWPDEGAQPLPEEKRETPQWLKDQLRDEFGADF